MRNLLQGRLCKYSTLLNHYYVEIFALPFDLFYFQQAWSSNSWFFPFFFCFPCHILYSFFLSVCFFEAILENRWMWAPMAQTSIIMSIRISSTRTVTALAKRRLLVALGGWRRRSRIWRRRWVSGRNVSQIPPFWLGKKNVNKSMWVFSELLSLETHTGLNDVQ